MHTPVIDIENISLQDLLTVDTHGELIRIKDKNAHEVYDLISNRQIFFKNLFAEVESDGIQILQDNDTISIEFDEFLKTLDQNRKSCVVLIEGFAGCGKSTLVQYILLKQLKTYNYDYSFYNYDLEAQNDLIIRDKSGKIIKRSSIFEAIKKSFCEQFVKIAKKYKYVIEYFTSLLEICKDYQPFNDLYYKFFITNTFREILEYVNDGIDDNSEKIVLDNLINQSGQIFSSTCLLALDYLLRLAMYRYMIVEKLYICYDNLDAIEDADDLKIFDDIIKYFRGIIDDFITFLQTRNYFSGMSAPHFIIMATYRKITASLAKISKYKEVRNDKNPESLENQYVFNIDATSTFSYSNIVAKRKKYFDGYFKNACNISESSKNKVLRDISSWHKLNQSLEIMNDRYACLWNRNYRTCSIIANELYSKDSYKFTDCVDFIEKTKNIDGYYTYNDIETGTYYGGSAILLSCVCKVFNNNHIWDKLLDLAPLDQDETSYENVSFSRLILTYMYNVKRAVSLKELYNIFCKKGLFSHEKLCEILSKMLARNLDGVWRRPIYYSSECILSEKAKDIEYELFMECIRFTKDKDATHDYKFLLCDSGRVYVEFLMQEFEFFSNRLSNKNKPLYLYNDINDIKSIICSVYKAVKQCCKNTDEFRKKYIKLNKISNKEYLSLPIHPTTNTYSSQLHIERTIFSHIAYLNSVRLYFLNKDVIPSLDKRKEYNIVFVDGIKDYLNLYYTYILPLASQRKLVATKLTEKVEKIQYAIKHDMDNILVLFESISL